MFVDFTSDIKYKINTKVFVTPMLSDNPMFWNTVNYHSVLN